MLAGLSPNTLSMANTLLACLVAGALGVLAASLTSLDATTLPLQVVPALGAALFARFTSFGIACAGRAPGSGVAQQLIVYISLDAELLVPARSRIHPLPGMQQLLVFVIIVIAMFWRGASLPGARRARRAAAARTCRGPSGSSAPPLIGTAACTVALIVFPFDFRQALINSLLGAVICLSLVVITGFVGQISIVQLALAGVAGFMHLPPRDRRRDRLPVRAAHRRRSAATLLGPADRRSPRCGCAGSAWPWSRLQLRSRSSSSASPTRPGGRGLQRFSRARAEAVRRRPRVERVLLPRRGLRHSGSTAICRARSSASSCSRSPSRSACSSPTCADRSLGPAHARRALERARRRRRRHQRAQRQARRLRRSASFIAGVAGALYALQLRLGQRDALQRADRARPDRLRLRRRHHDGLGRDLRRADLDRGALFPHVFEKWLGVSGHLHAARRRDWR